MFYIILYYIYIYLISIYYIYIIYIYIVYILYILFINVYCIYLLYIYIFVIYMCYLFIYICIYACISSICRQERESPYTTFSWIPRLAGKALPDVQAVRFVAAGWQDGPRNNNPLPSLTNSRRHIVAVVPSWHLLAPSLWVTFQFIKL